MGDDGFTDAILSMADDIKTVMNAFSLDYMTPIAKEVKREHYFLKKYEELYDKSETPGSAFTMQERSLLLKARFYLFLQRELREKPAPLVLDSRVIEDYIHNTIVSGSDYERYFSTDFFQEAYKVVDLVVNEVLTELKKHPQLVMFTDTKKNLSTKALIDKL